MKLVKIVKYQRVRYGDLEYGDEYLLQKRYSGPMIKGCTDSWHSHNVLRPAGKELVGATDTDKYPPESVTYNIEGIPDREMHECQEFGTTEPFEIGFSTEEHEDCVLWFPVGEIETRYV